MIAMQSIGRKQSIQQPGARVSRMSRFHLVKYLDRTQILAAKSLHHSMQRYRLRIARRKTHRFLIGVVGLLALSGIEVHVAQGQKRGRTPWVLLYLLLGG